MISKQTLWGLLASTTAELERIDPRSPVAALARAYLVGEDLPGPVEPPQELNKKRPYLDPGRAIRVADLHAEGMSTYQIAAALGCSVATAASDLKRQGIARDGRHFQATDPQRTERLRQMRSEGKTLEEMGQAEGVTRERVRQLCLKAGIATDAATRPLNEIERKAVTDYVSGSSLEQAAASAGVNPTTIRNWVIRADEKVRPSPKMKKRHPQTIANAERAAQLYERGLTAKEIAIAVGVSKPEMIYRLLAIAGVRPTRQRRLPDFDTALSTGREL